MVPILLWLLGVPIGLILILMLLGVVGQVFAHDLERHDPVEAGVAGPEDVRRSAPTDTVEQLVAGRD